MANSRVKLYSSADVLLYTFPLVQYTNVPQTPTNSVVIENIRGKGCLIIPGGDKAWDLIIRGILADTNYEDLSAKIVTLESTIALNTRYKIRIYRNVTDYWVYKVKRILPINYPDTLTFRNYKQNYEITFKVNSW